MRERNWDTVTRDEAARMLAWFDHPVFREIFKPLLAGERRHNADMALRHAMTGDGAIEAAVYAARASFVDKILAYEDMARSVLDSASDGEKNKKKHLDFTVQDVV